MLYKRAVRVIPGGRNWKYKVQTMNSWGFWKTVAYTDIDSHMEKEFQKAIDEVLNPPPKIIKYWVHENDRT